METEEEIKKVSVIVAQLMTEDERCRNDDKWLTFRVMQKFTNIFIPFEDFKKIPAFETVKRVRAKIQNKELRLLPTNREVALKRKMREDIFAKEFG
jgi:hypothetical protein